MSDKAFIFGMVVALCASVVLLIVGVLSYCG